MDYVCALSGVEAESGIPDEFSDELGTLPMGWTKVTIQRRLPNLEWQELQQVKQLAVQAAVSQLPEEQQVPQALRAIEIQIAAQFAALEDRLSPFLNMTEEIYVAPPEEDEALASAFYSMRESLGLPVPEEEDESTPSPE
tara:strand:+ start:274 stop:693 length:420 start_codon:yes stop_codon:yes gene_type:complete